MSCPAQRLFFVKGSVNSWWAHGLCLHHLRAEVWGKSCLSLTVQVLERVNLKVLLAGYCFRLCLRMRKTFNVLMSTLHTSADVVASLLSDCTSEYKSEYSKRRKI